MLDFLINGPHTTVNSGKFSAQRNRNYTGVSGKISNNSRSSCFAMTSTEGDITRDASNLSCISQYALLAGSAIPYIGNTDVILREIQCRVTRGRSVKNTSLKTGGLNKQA